RLTEMPNGLRVDIRLLSSMSEDRRPRRERGQPTASMLHAFSYRNCIDPLAKRHWRRVAAVRQISAEDRFHIIAATETAGHERRYQAATPRTKLSLITGSTSGIGLGIARALAAAGSDVVLNGFGKPEEVAQVQAKIATDFNVGVTYSSADVSKP